MTTTALDLQTGDHVLVAHRSDWDRPDLVRYSDVRRVVVTRLGWSAGQWEIVGHPVDALTGTRRLGPSRRFTGREIQGLWAAKVATLHSSLHVDALLREKWALEREADEVRKSLLDERLEALGLAPTGEIDEPGTITLDPATLHALLSNAERG